MTKTYDVVVFSRLTNRITKITATDRPLRGNMSAEGALEAAEGRLNCMDQGADIVDHGEYKIGDIYQGEA